MMWVSKHIHMWPVGNIRYDQHEKRQALSHKKPIANTAISMTCNISSPSRFDRGTLFAISTDMRHDFVNGLKRLFLGLLGMAIGAYACLLMSCSAPGGGNLGYAEFGAVPAKTARPVERNTQHIPGETLATYSEDLASYTPDPAMIAAGYLPWYMDRRDHPAATYTGPPQTAVRHRSIQRQYDHTYTTGRGDVRDRTHRRTYSETVVESVR